MNQELIDFQQNNDAPMDWWNAMDNLPGGRTGEKRYSVEGDDYVVEFEIRSRSSLEEMALEMDNALEDLAYDMGTDGVTIQLIHNGIVYRTLDGPAPRRYGMYGGSQKVYVAKNGARYIRLANGQTRFVRRR